MFKPLDLQALLKAAQANGVNHLVLTINGEHKGRFGVHTDISLSNLDGSWQATAQVHNDTLYHEGEIIPVTAPLQEVIKIEPRAAATVDPEAPAAGADAGQSEEKAADAPAESADPQPAAEDTAAPEAAKAA